MIPPNTPICSVWIPQTLTTVPLSTSPASDPSSRISPITFSMPLIVAFITKKEIMAASAATSFSFFAIPIATPTANMIGRLSKIMFPALLMMVSSALSTVPSPSMDSSPYVSIVVAFVKELPIPSSSPATGRIAIGSIKLRPTLCNTPKILSFICFPPSLSFEINVRDTQCCALLCMPHFRCAVLRTSIPLRFISVADSLPMPYITLRPIHAGMIVRTVMYAALSFSPCCAPRFRSAPSRSRACALCFHIRKQAGKPAFRMLSYVEAHGLKLRRKKSIN